MVDQAANVTALGDGSHIDHVDAETPEESTVEGPKAEVREYYMEECDLYRPEGFVTLALAMNNDIGRLCAIRRLDTVKERRAAFFVEFYNTLNLPCVVLEWRYACRHVALETAIWFGESVVIGCSDGAILVMSPFTRRINRIKVAASPIVAVAAFTADYIAVASESSEIKLMVHDPDEDFLIKKTIKLPSDQRAVSLAASADHSIIAAGLIDSIALIHTDTEEQNVIKIAQNPKKSIVVWSLLVLGDLLFSGDSQGKLRIHNLKTSALVKIFQTHQADILAMACDGKSVYVSGTDYRIQVLSSIKVGHKQFEWNTVGQRILHQNDVRCMACAGKWLISGGAEHHILLSTKRFCYRTIYPPRCSVVADGKHIIMPYLDYFEVWKRPEGMENTKNFRRLTLFTEENGPKKLLKFALSKHDIIVLSAASPDGQHVVLSTITGLFIYVVKFKDDDGHNRLIGRRVKFVPHASTEQVTALHLTNSAVYYSCGNLKLIKIDFETLSSTTLAVRECDSMLTRLDVDPSETRFLALTTRSELLYCDLNPANAKDDDEQFERLDLNCVPNDAKLIPNGDGDPLAVICTSGMNGKLLFFNLKTKEQFKPPLPDLEYLGGNDIIVSASNVLDNSIILLGASGFKCLVVGQLNEPKQTVVASTRWTSAMKLEHKRRKRADSATMTEGGGDDARDEEDERMESDGGEMGGESEAHDEEEDVEATAAAEHHQPEVEDQIVSGPTISKKTRNNKRVPPFPREVHWAPSADRTYILSIGTESGQPQTWTPIDIRRFGRQ